MKITTIKIDVSFPDKPAEKLKRMLETGWKIIDKSILQERYLFYVLQFGDTTYRKNEGYIDPDVGKTSDSLNSL